MPATSPAAIAPATSTAPIETHQRIAALPSFHGDGDTQDAPRKAGTCVAVHIRVSRRYRPPALIGCPSWVKLRRTQCEHMFSALPPTRTSLDVVVNHRRGRKCESDAGSLPLHVFYKKPCEPVIERPDLLVATAWPPGNSDGALESPVSRNGNAR